METQDPLDLTAEERRRDEAKREQDKRRSREITDFEWLMQDPRGRRFVWRLMEQGGVFRSSFSGDALATVFKEGQRDQGLKLLNEVLAVCPEQWTNMIKDQKTQ